MYRKQQGFTLVEIAIVLVIIGLLLGGVLKGQELINSAKIKNVANDLNGISAGVYAYQDRYKTFPGDDSGASSRWTGAPNGNKDGVIQGEFCSAATAAEESIYFWRHLRLSGLIAGDTATGEQPQNAVGGIVGVQTGTGASGAIELGGLVVCSTNLSGKIAEAIDSQFDDGKPNTGTLHAYDQNKTPVARGCTTNVVKTAAVTSYNAADESFLYTICKSM
jgi:prepilin-type N-terminal cleavage/methylation domain-containing protein